MCGVSKVIGNFVRLPDEMTGRFIWFRCLVLPKRNFSLFRNFPNENWRNPVAPSDLYKRIAQMYSFGKILDSKCKYV